MKGETISAIFGILVWVGMIFLTVKYCDGRTRHPDEEYEANPRDAYPLGVDSVHHYDSVYVISTRIDTVLYGK